MPVEECSENERPGFRWGEGGKCYTYAPGNAASRARARDLAGKQGQRIAFERARERGARRPSERDFG